MDYELILSFKDLSYTFLVDHSVVDILRSQTDRFLIAAHDVPTEPQTIAELVLHYLRFLVTGHAPDSAITPIIRAVTHDLLGHDDIHSLIDTFELHQESRDALLNSFYTAVTRCHVTLKKNSALFNAAENRDACLAMVWSGQGTGNPFCIQELADLNKIYGPLLADLLSTASPLLSRLCRLPETKDYYRTRAIALDTWLQDPASQPSLDFVASAAVSFPLIGVIGLAHFCIICKVTGRTPGELRSILKGVTGHSQGLLVAVAVAVSDTWDDFYDVAGTILEALFWIGYECHLAAPRSSIPAQLVQHSLQCDEGQPSCMLSVRGLVRSEIDSFITRHNDHAVARDEVFLALTNARDNFVIAGPASALIHFSCRLRDAKADLSLDQSRIPFSKRKPVIFHQFLPISAPFHTPYLESAAKVIKCRLANKVILAEKMTIPVYHSNAGRDVRDLGCENIIDVLVDAVTCEPVDWTKALELPGTSHIVVLGSAGIGEIVKKATDGKGVRILMGDKFEAQTAEVGCKHDLFSSQLLESSARLKSWAARFRPRLTVAADGRTMVDTKLSRLLRSPPVMVAGMTPTTTHWDFVSAIADAGYHAELACGGYHNAEAMSTAISKLVAVMPGGRGITCNLIYASPHAFSWQLSLLRRLAQNGTPIDGLTIGAGVPSAEVIAEYITDLRLKHISLKPGSQAAIRQVIGIAKAHPEFPIILQWTGGRGGGHHSFEDFHVPMLNTYGLIRDCSNIILVAGSGFGGGNDTWPYLTGAWATRFGAAHMPFDGIMLGSRMMVAREAHTSPMAKELILQQPGVPDQDWEQSYDGSAGGFVTVQSEMGQPIHKLANRGVMFWAEMDKLIFSLPRNKRVAALQKHRDHIIRRLNADFAKPWFGLNSHGEVVELSAMTYAEVLARLVSLMYVNAQGRWIDHSYARFVEKFAQRALERLRSSLDAGALLSKLAKPSQFLRAFVDHCPESANHVLHPEDVQFFLILCTARGQKPVNFVPTLDGDFETFFKKDSLWQSEDLEAVVGQDANRVCILHGPVAAQYSRSRDESVKEILDGISRVHVEEYEHELVSGFESQVSRGRTDSEESIDASSPSPLSATTWTEVTTPPTSSSGDLDVWPEFPLTLDDILDQTRLGNSFTWLTSLLNNEFVLQGHIRRPSPLKSLYDARADISIRVDGKDSASIMYIGDDDNARSLVNIRRVNDAEIEVDLCQPSAQSNRILTLPLRYSLGSGTGEEGLCEVMTDRNHRIKSFYSELWFGEDISHDFDAHSIFHGQEMQLTQKMYQDLVSTITLAVPEPADIFSESDIFPMSIGIVIAWEVISKPLVLKDIDGDLLRLVHHSNTFDYRQGALPIRIGDFVSTRSRVKEIRIEEHGKYVTVEAEIYRDNEAVMVVTSTFLFRGTFHDFGSTFRTTTEPQFRLQVANSFDEAVLRDRQWLSLRDPLPSLQGSTILFELQTSVTWQDEKTYGSMRVNGTVYRVGKNDELKDIGQVEFHCEECNGNPVVDYLQRKGLSAPAQVELASPGWAGSATFDLKVPASNEIYATISKDYNPIHVSPLFAAWADLPGTITHGMYTSAITASILDYLAADGQSSRMHRFSATFTDMVLPGDLLSIRIQHVGMQSGRMLIKVSVFKKQTDEKVLEAEAEIEQAPTAYIFTGQGSQSQGMGMDLYDTSPVARAVWDDVDHYILDTYGWSVIDVVRHNPKTLTIHFGGKRGRQIRNNYLAMDAEVVHSDGSTSREPILRGLKPDSPSFTFSESRGLLFSTQFAQPAILLLQNATLQDMRAHGLVQEDATYAGHSLGEYGALSGFSKFMSIKALMDVCFYRGLVMQQSVVRDSDGETNFSMVATNPRRVGRFFDERALRAIVDTIARESGTLLEIVNFNVEGEQYVCAGTVANLYVLSSVLTHLSKASSSPHQPLSDAPPVVPEELQTLISSLIAQSSSLPRPIRLSRGAATIPLEGIDFPFHSAHLRPGVDAFRQFLLQRISRDDIHPDLLVGKFIPNVMAKAFSLEEDYVKEACQLTGSSILGSLLQTMQRERESKGNEGSCCDDGVRAVVSSC